MNDNARDFGPLKPDIFDILLALEAEPLHGYGIIAAVEARSGESRSLLPSLLYRRLARLVEGGVVCVAEVPGDDDPRRKHYELTDLGRSVLRQEAERIVELGKSLERHRWRESKS